jgi:hypothetical protein
MRYWLGIVVYVHIFFVFKIDLQDIIRCSLVSIRLDLDLYVKNNNWDFYMVFWSPIGIFLEIMMVPIGDIFSFLGVYSKDSVFK